MKRAIILLIMLLLPSLLYAGNGFLGVKKASSYVVCGELSTLDSAGFEIVPDSFTVRTYADNGSTAAYSVSITTIPSAQIDTTKLQGGTQYWFVDQIQDIDGAGGNFQLAITISGWKYGKQTKNNYTVQVIPDSLTVYLADVQNINGWNPATTGVLLVDSAITVAKIKNAAITSGKYASGAITATAIAANAIGASQIADSAITVAKIKNATITSGKYAAGAITATAIATDAITADKIAADAIGSSELASTAAAEIEDSIYAQRNDYKATVVAIIDSVNAILDTLQLHDTRLDSLLAALADASIGDKVWTDAAARTLTALGFNFDSTDFADSIFALDLFATNYWTGNVGINWGDISNKTDVVNLSQTSIDYVVSTSTVTNVNDKTGYALTTAEHGNILDSIMNAPISDTGAGDWAAIVARPTAATVSDADMADIADTVWGKAARTITGGALTTPADYKADVSGLATLANQTLIKDTISAILDTLVDGFASRSQIGDTATGGYSSYLEVQNIDGWNPITDNDSLIVDQSSLEDMTVATVTNGVTLADGAITAAKIATSAIDSSKIAADAIGASEIGTDAIGNSELGVGAISSAELHGSAVTEILDSLFDTRTVADTTTGTFLAQLIRQVKQSLDSLQSQDGWVAKEATVQIIDDTLDAWDDDIALLNPIRDTVNGIIDTTQNQDGWIATAASLTNAIDSINAILDSIQAGIAATVSAANMASIADSVWMADTAANNGVAGSYGKVLADPNYVQGTASGLTATQVADTVWRRPFPGSPAAGSYEDSASGWGATSASDLTATKVADTVWGAASRTITGTGTDAITATSIAADAIGSSELASTAAAEIEDSVHQQVADYKATGFSVAGDPMTLTPAERGAVEDSIHAQAADYKADVSGLATTVNLTQAIDSINAVLDTLQAGFGSRSLIGDTAQGGDEIFAEVQNIDGWNPITDSDSLVVDLSTLASATVGLADSAITVAKIKSNAITASGIATDAIGFMEIASGAIGADEIATGAIGAPEIASDAIGADEIATNAIGSLELASTAAAEIEDSIHAQAADYKADLTAAQDSLNVLTAALKQVRDSLQYLVTATGFSTFNPASDSVIVDVSAADAGLIPAIEDTIHANAADYKSTGTSTFDPTTDSVIIDVSSNLVYADTVANRVKEDSSVYQGSTGLTAASIAAEVDDTLTTNHGSGSWQTGGTGSGLYSVWFYAIDSSANDTLSGVSVVLQNAAGTQIATGTTNDSGYVEMLVDGSIRILGYLSPAYTFDAASATITANDTINVLGYPNTIASPTDPDYCRAYAYLKHISDDWAQDIIVTVNRVSGAATNTTNGFTIMPLHRVDTTNASGYFYFDLLQTQYYDDTTKGLYNFIGKYKNSTVFYIDSLVMPAQSTLDLTDSIAVRGTL